MATMAQVQLKSGGKIDGVKKVADIWQTCINPLDGLTQREIEWMFQSARRGDDTRLQQAYALIEQTMPIFGICMDKRISQVTDLDWEVDGQGDAAKRVEEVLRKCDTDNSFDGTSGAIEHLMAYSFRGRSVVKPFYSEEDGLSLKRIQNWNILLKNGKFYWNPMSEPVVDFDKLDVVPESEILFCHTERAIDMPGMLIYLRQTIGETKWSQFVERQGIPQVLITAPEGTPDSSLPAWTRRAQQIMNGGSGVLPPGSKVDQLTDARGQDPFSEFCRHQMEMIAILATGGTLNTIGGSTGLGSNLADVQNEQFMKLVRRDIRQVEKTMTRLCKWTAGKIGVPSADVQFKFKMDTDQTELALSTAERLKNLGAVVDLEKLKNYVKMDLMADDGQSGVWSPDEKKSTEGE